MLAAVHGGNRKTWQILLPTFKAGSNNIKPCGVFAVTISIVSYGPETGSGSSTSNGNDISFGHACILVENYSSYAITVGHMRVEPGDYISVGAFDSESSPNNEHSGVWYDVEAYELSGLSGGNYAAAAYDITESELSTLNSYINSHNYYILMIETFGGYTCASFAAGCWNSVVLSSYKLTSTSIPKDLADRIRNLNLPTPPLPSQKDRNEYIVAYHTSTGVVYWTTRRQNSAALLFN